MVQSTAQDQHTPEEAARFPAALARYLQAQVSRNGRCLAWTDYDPETVLCAAAAEAGIEVSRYSLPIKSGSTGSARTAKVKQGYWGDWRSIRTRAEGATP
jgi:hypothetical protein